MTRKTAITMIGCWAAAFMPKSQAQDLDLKFGKTLDGSFGGSGANIIATNTKQTFSLVMDNLAGLEVLYKGEMVFVTSQEIWEALHGDLKAQN